MSNSDYNKIHINPVPGSGSCGSSNPKRTYLYTYNKLIEQIEKLYQKMLNEYKSLEVSDNIILGSLADVKDCYTIINHNVKTIKEIIFKRNNI